MKQIQAKPVFDFHKYHGGNFTLQVYRTIYYMKFLIVFQSLIIKYWFFRTLLSKTYKVLVLLSKKNGLSLFKSEHYATFDNKAFVLEFLNIQTILASS